MAPIAYLFSTRAQYINKTAFKYLLFTVVCVGCDLPRLAKEKARVLYRRMQLDAYHSIRRPLIPNHVTGIQTL